MSERQELTAEWSRAQGMVADIELEISAEIECHERAADELRRALAGEQLTGSHPDVATLIDRLRRAEQGVEETKRALVREMSRDVD